VSQRGYRKRNPKLLSIARPPSSRRALTPRFHAPELGQQRLSHVGSQGCYAMLGGVVEQSVHELNDIARRTLGRPREIVEDVGDEIATEWGELPLRVSRTFTSAVEIELDELDRAGDVYAR